MRRDTRCYSLKEAQAAEEFEQCEECKLRQSYEKLDKAITSEAQRL